MSAHDHWIRRLVSLGEQRYEQQCGVMYYSWSHYFRRLQVCVFGGPSPRVRDVLHMCLVMRLSVQPAMCEAKVLEQAT